MLGHNNEVVKMFFKYTSPGVDLTGSRFPFPPAEGGNDTLKKRRGFALQLQKDLMEKLFFFSFFLEVGGLGRK